MRIDFHIHAFPPGLREDALRFAECHGERLWLETVAGGGAGEKGARSIQGWVEAEATVTALRAARMDGALLLGWYWERAAACRWHNRLMADWVKMHPDFFRFFAAVPPAGDAGEIRDVLDEAAELGAVGIGELHCGTQGFAVRSPGWKTVLNFCGERSWPVNFHVTDPAGAAHPGRRETPPKVLRPLIDSLEGLPVVLAHLAGGAAMSQALFPGSDMAGGVSVDTAALPRLYPASDWKSQMGRWRDRILPGSDFPLRLYPGEGAEGGLLRFVDALACESLLLSVPQWATELFGRASSGEDRIDRAANESARHPLD